MQFNNMDNSSVAIQGINNGSVIIHNGKAHTISSEAAELLRIYETLDLSARVRLLCLAIELDKSTS
jgi:hypothetical protein